MAEIDTESLGLYLPQIDPRNEEQLFRQSQMVAFNRSLGTLNDFSDHNPLAALLQGQAFAGAELLFYANRQTLALLIKFLEVTGSVRSLGSKATVLLTFSLTAPLSNGFLIPQGFEVTNTTGDRRFTTDIDLSIPKGQLSGTVSATAAEIGEGYNLPAYTINQFTQPLAFLATVVNVDPSQGGANAQTIEEAIQQALVALRRRNIVTADDYEQAAIAILGSGSRVKAIGLLAGDMESYQLGAVHIFALDSAGSPATSGQCRQVLERLTPNIQIGTSLYVSPMGVLNTYASMEAKLAEGEDPEAVGDRLWAAFDSFLARSAVGSSVIIRELEHEIRFAGGLSYIQNIRLNGEDSDLAMPNLYTTPAAYSLNMRLVDDTGTIFEVMRGEGEPEGFDAYAYL